MRDASTGTSRGFGFVTFASSFMTEAALDKAPFDICGVKITPKKATPDKVGLFIFLDFLVLLFNVILWLEFSLIPPLPAIALDYLLRIF